MGWLADLLKEIPSAARYKAELEQLASEHSALKAENKNLRAELQQRAAKIHALQPAKQPFEESMGVLWKRTKDGFEPAPYCKDCPTHPIFTYIRQARLLICGVAGHHAPPNVKPPDA